VSETRSVAQCLRSCLVMEAIERRDVRVSGAVRLREVGE